jgi:hypothetical protein
MELRDLKLLPSKTRQSTHAEGVIDVLLTLTTQFFQRIAPNLFAREPFNLLQPYRS